MVVEDNEGDMLLLRIALEEAGLNFNLQWISDGIAAVEMLKSHDAKVDLLVLDVSLPGRTGWQILEHVAQNPALRHVHTVVLSGSDNAFDIARAHRAGVSFFHKPLYQKGYDKIVQNMASVLVGNE